MTSPAIHYSCPQFCWSRAPQYYHWVRLWVIFYPAPDEMQLNIVVPCALERQEMGFGKKWPQTSPNTGGVYFCKEPFSADVTPRPFFSLGLMWHPGLPCCKIPHLTATSFSSKCPMSDVKDLHISKLGNRRCFWEETRSIFQSAVWKFVQVFIRVPQVHHYLRSHYHNPSSYGTSQCYIALIFGCWIISYFVKAWIYRGALQGIIFQ